MEIVNKHINKAKKLLGKWSFFYSGNKYEDAIDEICKAINFCKLQKEKQFLQQSAQLSVWCGEISGNLFSHDESHLNDVISHYENAAKYYFLLEDIKQCITCNSLVIQYAASSQFTATAKAWKNIALAQQMDVKLYSVEHCIESWKNAEKYFDAADSFVAGEECKAQVAQLYFENKQLDKAMECFYNLAKSAANGSTPLSKYRASLPLYHALLCQLNLLSQKGDLDGYADCLTQALEIYPAFETSREYKFLQDISVAFQKDDLEAFNSIVFKYDNIRKLTDIESKLLIPVKQVLQNGIGQNNQDVIDLT